MSNFFEVFYLGRARFSQSRQSLTPEFVDKAVNKLGQEINSLRLGTSQTCANIATGLKSVLEEEGQTQRSRSHTIATDGTIDIKKLLNSKSLSVRDKFFLLLFPFLHFPLLF